MATNNAANYATGASGTVLTGNGVGVTPTFQSPSPSTNVAFSAVLSATATNQTGNAAYATVICDTELFDVGSNYNNTTGVFTAPSTGKYFATAQIYFGNVSVLMTKASINIDINSTTRVWQSFINPSVIRDASNQGVTMTLSGFLDLTSGDTVKLVGQISNGAADTASFFSAGNSFPMTTFAMWKVT